MLRTLDNQRIYGVVAMDLMNTENQNALLEIILDLKNEALLYKAQAEDEHDFALRMMKERDDFERDISKLERENEELTNQRDQLREQLEECTDGRNLHAELLDAQADRDIARNKNKELEEELHKVEAELNEMQSQRDIAENDVEQLLDELATLRAQVN